MAKRRAKAEVIFFPGVEDLPRSDHLEAVQEALGLGLDIMIILGIDADGEYYINCPMGMTEDELRSLFDASLRELRLAIGKPGGRGGKT